MVEKEEIWDKSGKILPKNINNLTPSDDEIWEGEEGGAKFILTHDIMPTNPAMRTIYSLSVSGDLDGQVKVVGDFVETFGKPAWREDSDLVTGGETVIWNGDVVDQKRK